MNDLRKADYTYGLKYQENLTFVVRNSTRVTPQSNFRVVEVQTVKRR